MSLDFTKVTYVDGETVIGADNLNDIQDALLDLDDNKVEKEQGKGLSANDYTDTDKQKVDDAYVVPESGIPKSALASAVQTSLGKADTALQEDDLEPYRTAEEQDEIDNALDDRASVPVTVGPSAVATFESSTANTPLKSLTINIEPVQSGTGDPSPTNVRPISGWTGAKVERAGKNLWKTFQTQTNNNVTITVDSDGGCSLSVSGEQTAQARFIRYVSIPAGTYYLSANNAEAVGAGVRLMLVSDKGGPTMQMYLDSANKGMAITLPVEYSQLRITINADATFSSAKFYPQLELGSTSSAYEPFVANDIYPITFPASAGTVYGGSLDAVNKMLTVEYAATIITGSESDLQYNWDGVALIRSEYIGSSYASAINGCICSHTGNVITGNAFYGSKDSSEYPVAASISAGPRVRFRNRDAGSTLEEYRTYLQAQYTAGTPVTIVGKLASPIEIAITAEQVTTLLGTNNIWADCGNVTVTYGAYLKDIKDYVDQVDSGILSAVAPLEGSYTASRNYAVGSYLFVGTKFYKVTSAIQTGGTINPGTNVAQTTVAEQLMTLAVKPAILG